MVTDFTACWWGLICCFSSYFQIPVSVLPWLRHPYRALSNVFKVRLGLFSEGRVHHKNILSLVECVISHPLDSFIPFSPWLLDLGTSPKVCKVLEVIHLWTSLGLISIYSPSSLLPRFEILSSSATTSTSSRTYQCTLKYLLFCSSFPLSLLMLPVCLAKTTNGIWLGLSFHLSLCIHAII